MDAVNEMHLYLWIQGNPYQAPEVYAMAAPAMALSEFRDRYVDSSRGYLIIRIEEVCDQPIRVTQECKGQRYLVSLVPEVEIIPGLAMIGSAGPRRVPELGLTAIKGIGRRYAALLHEKANVNSVQALLDAGATPQGREQLRSQTGLPPQTILRWVQLADLMRVEGVGSDYSHLLRNAGITSVPMLAAQKPRPLLKKLTQTKEKQGGVRRLPYLEQVADWIQQASNLEPVVVP